MSWMWHSEAGDSCLFPLILSAFRTLTTPKCVLSCQSGGSCFFGCPWTRTVHKMCGFLPPGPCPLSLLICSYLPGVALLPLCMSHPALCQSMPAFVIKEADETISHYIIRCNTTTNHLNSSHCVHHMHYQITVMLTNFQWYSSLL